MEFYTDNPVRDAENYDRYLAEKEKGRPKCTECGEPIADGDALHWHDVWLCKDCLKHFTETFIADEWRWEDETV